MARLQAPLLVTLVVLAAASLCAAAPKKAAVNPAGIFLASALKNPTYYYPGVTFSQPRCGAVTGSGDLAFKVDVKGGAVVLDYLYSPNYFSDGLPFSFSVLNGIGLNTKTGVLTLKGYGLTVTVDLRTYLANDQLQKMNRCKDRKTKALARNSFLFNYSKLKQTAALSQTDSLVKNALNVLIDTVKCYSKAQPQCSNPSPNNGDASMANWVQYLTKVSALVGGTVNAVGC